jgi:hypothetical protein
MTAVCQSQDRPGAACRLPRPERCHACGRDATTILLPLSSGHIGRCCGACRATRKGRPFATKPEFQNFLANADSGRGLCYVKQ